MNFRPKSLHGGTKTCDAGSTGSGNVFGSRLCILTRAMHVILPEQLGTHHSKRKHLPPISMKDSVNSWLGQAKW